MFNQPEMSRALETSKIDTWADQVASAASRLPRRLKTIALDLLVEPTYMYDKQAKEIARRYEKALAGLARLKPKDRLRVFQVYFPKIAPTIEQAWQLHAQLPYQTGLQRKAFRAPGRPDLAAWNQTFWFSRLLASLRGFDPDLEWLAIWAPHIRSYGSEESIGVLLAAAIIQEDAHSRQVMDLLVDSANGEHEISRMGRHIPIALLTADALQGWNFLEKLLLAAQRQEGLRQVILETVDLAHPQAFVRMLRLILDQHLLRFASVVRAVDAWFGFQWQAANLKVMEKVLEDTLVYLTDRPRREAAIVGDDPQQAYLALWATAYEDAYQSIEPAAAFLRSNSVDLRVIGAHFLSQLQLKEARAFLREALEDPSQDVMATALLGLMDYTYGESAGDLFDHLEKVVLRLPKRMKRKSRVWPWMEITIDRRQVFGMLIGAAESRSPKRLVPFLPEMDYHNRARVIGLLAKDSQKDPEVRGLLLENLSDRSRYVRECVLEALGKHVAARPLQPGEIGALESLLLRRSADLRRGVLKLLLTQEDSGVAGSVERLLASAKQEQRLAGLDLLSQMQDAGRSSQRTRDLIKSLPDQAAPSESVLITRLRDDSPPASLENGLGLYDPGERTPPTEPQPRKDLLQAGNGKSLIADSALALLEALDGWVHEHRNTPVTVQGWQGSEQHLLGNLAGYLAQGNLFDESQSEALVESLLESSEGQWSRLVGPEGIGLFQALAALSQRRSMHTRPSKEKRWVKKLRRQLYGDPGAVRVEYPWLVETLIHWLMQAFPTESAPDYLLDAVGHTLAGIPEKEIAHPPAEGISGYYGYEPGWRADRGLLSWLQIARTHRQLSPDTWLPEHFARLYSLLRWLDQPAPGWPRSFPQLHEVLDAYYAGGASEADILDQLMGGPNLRYGYSSLHQFSGIGKSQFEERYPILTELVDRIRERVVAVELQRGDLATPASHLARALNYSGGMDVLLDLLAAMGGLSFVRGYAFDSLAKAATFSKLVRSTLPGEQDAPEDFALRAKERGIPEKRLVELAVYAPQWARHIETALCWHGLSEGVWWLHAHTKDTHWVVDHEIRQMWMASISKRTDLSGPDLLDGAVDVAWFRRCYEALGAERWGALVGAAKLASGGRGHARAVLFSEAILGLQDPEALVKRIRDKRYQDAVRALGLLPLPEGAGREEELLARYGELQEFLRTSRKFGAQRRQSEKLAVRIGMENLARTAGYADPRRLEWILEARQTSALKDGKVMAEAGGVRVTLAVTSWGETELIVMKGDRRLKHVPARIKKDPGIAGLLDLRRTVKRQGSRMRKSLEESMVRGESFLREDLQDLLAHPVLAPMLTQLVFVGETGLGYLGEDGCTLVAHDGSLLPARDQTALRIAHPADLLENGDWHKWQESCFRQERIQPFKQIFRELYLLTDAEKENDKVSRRYAGQQVNPQQAAGVLGSRLWVLSPYEGATRTFQQEGLIACLEFLAGYGTPAEVAGSTIEGIFFVRRDEIGRLDLDQVPPRIFSEVMRDLDLVVSVAHAGGVDPEATSSTVEMRAAMIRETMRWLGIDNVHLDSNWALIEGSRGSYNVHLGSGVVHRQPGGSVCIIPVHDQHRGRIFLPFADQDPKTAEVVSKVLLLAEDQNIQDPTILEQLG
ncbi:MAG: DUF5724 domain-containing protein [Anaerolineales bacterium]|nr:DUF5724 domain-containing protein [Anaerolineales bacterium]